jgi:hypothetical protein
MEGISRKLRQMNLREKRIGYKTKIHNNVIILD